MRPENHVPLTPRMEEAVQELKGMITTRFPQATFVVEEGTDPKGIYLVTRPSAKNCAKFPLTPFSLTHSEGR